MLKPMIGLRFGNVVVLARDSHRAHGRQGCKWVTYRVRCDCGLEKVVFGPNLRSGRTKSCGCRFSRRLSSEEAARRHFLLAYKANALRYGRVFELTKEEFYSLTTGDCHYCGEPPSRLHKNQQEKRIAMCPVSGIDRKDNTIGYVADNCVPCCANCNRAKGVMPYAEYLGWITRVRNRPLYNNHDSVQQAASGEA